MKALSIRQPWAHFILHHGKDIENRTKRTRLRGQFLIHVSATMTRDEFNDANNFAIATGHATPFDVPSREQLALGGIIGSVELVDCVDDSESVWYMGYKGYVLRDPRPMPFIPYRGQLGFFEVPDSVLGEHLHEHTRAGNGQ